VTSSPTIGPLKAWLDLPLEDRVMALVEDPSLLELVRDLIEQYQAAQEALRRIAVAVEAWDNDETPDEDFPFAADMDFVNFCGHVARAALGPNPASRQDG
jgi:hypothetical protein